VVATMTAAPANGGCSNMAAPTRWCCCNGGWMHEEWFEQLLQSSRWIRVLDAASFGVDCELLL